MVRVAVLSRLMDLIPVDENESSLFDMINLILDEVVAFTVYEIVDFIFFMDMFVWHVKIIIPDNAVDRQTDVGFFVNKDKKNDTLTCNEFALLRDAVLF